MLEKLDCVIFIEKGYIPTIQSNAFVVRLMRIWILSNVVNLNIANDIMQSQKNVRWIYCIIFMSTLSSCITSSSFWKIAKNRF